MSRVFVSPLATPFHSLVSIFPIPSRYISIFRAPPPRYFSPSLKLCQFFIDHNIELENLTCDTYQAPHTNTTMLNATITVTLPAGTQISWLRDQFLDFADALNLDALIEPWRPQHP